MPGTGICMVLKKNKAVKKGEITGERSGRNLAQVSDLGVANDPTTHAQTTSKIAAYDKGKIFLFCIV